MSDLDESRAIDTGTDQILCRVEDRVAMVTLNRPDARNALTREMKRALGRLIPALGDDEGVGCLLLSGAGGGFCAGGDTKLMARDGRPTSPEERIRVLRAVKKGDDIRPVGSDIEREATVLRWVHV